MSSRDWDLGQALIELGFCTLDQVREALAIRELEEKKGGVPPSLEEVLLERGIATAEQMSRARERLGAPPLPVPPPAPDVPKKTGLLWAGVVLLAAGIITAVLSVRGERPAAECPPPVVKKPEAAPPPPVREEAVRTPPKPPPEEPPKPEEQVNRERHRRERIEKDISERYLMIDGDFKAALARRDPRGAAEVVRRFVYGPWKELESGVVRVEGVDYEALEKALEGWEAARVAEICDAAMADVAAMPDTAHAALLDLRNAALVRLFFDDAAAAAGPGSDIGKLSEESLASLVEKTGKSTSARIGFFCYYAAGDLHEKAYLLLMRAHAEGARGIKPFLANRVAPAQEDLERALEVKFGAAGEYLSRGQWAPAKALLEQVLKHPARLFTQKKRVEIDRMLVQAAEGAARDAKLAGYYGGRVDRVDMATLRVTYDFESADQAAAFEGVAEAEGRVFKGRWGIDRGVMESSVVTSVTFWKQRLKGDVEVEYDVTPLEAPQNIVLDLYYNKGIDRHYGVVFGFDWVGKADGDRENTAEDRWGMPRTCVIKYPVSADRQRWREEEPWTRWKERLVGKRVGEGGRLERDRPSRVRVIRKGAAIRVLLDGAPVWEGEDADYTEGRLVFFSDTRCRLDNLSIVFKP